MPSDNPSNQQSTRVQIVDAADRLFYQRGFENTSFADIADVVKISRGNFYYHFRTKDEILDAVLEARLEAKRKMLAEWEIEFELPEARICRYIDILLVNRVPIKRFGCPVGMLCSELARIHHQAQPEANAIFTLFRTWLRRQFEELGQAADADALALHVIGRSQGIAVMAMTFGDERFISREVELLHDWLKQYSKGSAAAAVKRTQGQARATQQQTKFSKRSSRSGKRSD